jgi:hypothetical protein
MMVKQILCDFCNKNEGQTIMLQAGYKMGYGESGYSRYEYYDICLSCLIDRIQSFFENQPLKVNQAFTNIMKVSQVKVVKMRAQK